MVVGRRSSRAGLAISGAAALILGCGAGWFCRGVYNDFEKEEKPIVRPNPVSSNIVNDAEGNYTMAAVRVHRDSPAVTDAVAVIDMRRVNGFRRYEKPFDQSTAKSFVYCGEGLEDPNVPVYFFITDGAQREIGINPRFEQLIETTFSRSLYERAIVLDEGLGKLKPEDPNSPMIRDLINWGDLTYLIDAVVPAEKRTGSYDFEVSRLRMSSK